MKSIRPPVASKSVTANTCVMPGRQSRPLTAAYAKAVQDAQAAQAAHAAISPLHGHGPSIASSEAMKAIARLREGR